MRWTLLVVVIATTAPAFAQQPQMVGAQFDVVSIKPHKSDQPGGGMRMEPDGTQMMTNVAVRQFILAAATEPVVDVVGLPDWTRTERYDLIAKPAPGSTPTREQRGEMMRNLFVDRMKLVAHIAEEERTTFALVLARSDGRLGPNLKKSELDCAALAREKMPPDRPRPDVMRSCGMRMGGGTIESGGIQLDQLVRSLGGLAGGLVNNRTGLDGYYSVSLHYALPSLNADPSAPPPPGDDAPQFVTALQEQLGLKLVPEKTKVKILVVDHIERPTPD
ncbi:MAG TPA: TIGR03435 family protein [Vicinamibacterales bacterium]|nr:TIGR03435 family protein [Vicinamibacterales bacterium]